MNVEQILNMLSFLKKSIGFKLKINKNENKIEKSVNENESQRNNEITWSIIAATPEQPCSLRHVLI